MKTAFRASLAGSGIAVAILAVPAMADLLPSEQQRIIRTLMDQGYTNVSVLQDDNEVTVVGSRDGRTYAFAYEPTYQRFIAIGQNIPVTPSLAVLGTRSGDGDGGDSGGGMGGGGMGGGMGGGGGY